MIQYSAFIFPGFEQHVGGPAFIDGQFINGHVCIQNGYPVPIVVTVGFAELDLGQPSVEMRALGIQ